jgi:predicted alpha/beta superfamily hydrolase
MRFLTWTLILLALSFSLLRCGGDGGGSSGPTMEGSTEKRNIKSASNGTTYPLDIYLPPASAGSRANLPIVYALDGESRFAELVNIAETTRARIIIVAIGNQANRAIDYVPVNTCTPNGGGHVAYLDFIRSELIPFIETSIGGDPRKRALLGHSHGGSFVFYAIFAEAAASHHFAAYLASDASIGCMPATMNGWEESYAAANTSLPVRLHISYGANMDNSAFAQRIQQAHFADLSLHAQFYSGGHIGMIPAAFTDAIAFAFSASNQRTSGRAEVAGLDSQHEYKSGPMGETSRRHLGPRLFDAR